MIQLHSNTSSSRRLVIVEDEGILALDLERHLSGAGFDVCGVAADSEEAMRLVERERPDLVLMDIHLQGKLDGVETAAALRERFDVSVVYLTAHGDATTIERAQRTDPMGYLLKPFKKPDLQNVVTIALARSHSERRLRRREQALSTTLSCIDEAVLTTDISGNITYINRAGEELVGRPAAQTVQRSLHDVMPLRSGDGTALAQGLVADARTHGRVQLQAQLAQPEGTRTVVGTAASLKQGEADFGVVVALRDLTELLNARRQLEFAERLSALGTLSAGVAHEVNNPLAVVLANLNFALGSDGITDPEVKEALGEAHDAAKRVAHIVRELQAFARPQAEQLLAIDPRTTLSSALSFTRTHWRRVCGVVLELGALPPVLAAPTRLSQVFVNLIINAVHAMEEHGTGPHTLTLTTGTNERGEAVLTVSDTGPGIPEELRLRVFEPFFTTKPRGRGTGLGLAVSRNILESFGGKLSIATGPGGRGTSFSIVLPATVAAERPAVPRVLWVGPQGAEGEALVKSGRARAIAADDEAGLRALLGEHTSELVLLAVGADKVRELRALLPEFEAKALLVGEAEPPVGVMCLRQPFDPNALATLVRSHDE